jgi:hypothetical protein
LIILLLIMLVIRNTRPEKESFAVPPDSIAATDSAGNSVTAAGELSPANPVIEKMVTHESGKITESDMGNGSKTEPSRADTSTSNDSLPAQIQHSPPVPRDEPAVRSKASTHSAIDSAIPDCRKIKFSMEISVLESCNNKPTGSFLISRESVTGGKPPYMFSLSRSKFDDSLEFASLFSGNYPVYVKDGNNCIGLGGTAQIGSFDCTYQAVFAPLKGETWSVPAEDGKDGTLRIISKSGAMVYTIKLTSGGNPVWNGESTAGQLLPMGIYQFDIAYTDGSRFGGNVTIIK